MALPITAALVLAGALISGCGSGVGAPAGAGDPGTSAVSIAPPAAIAPPGGKVAFEASAAAGTVSPAVQWSVVESSGGSISSSGLYTAPSGLGRFHVVATSVADPTKSGQAAVTVEGGSGPTAASASTVGTLTVQTYSSGIPLGTDYVNPTIYYPTGGTPPYPGLVFVAGFCETYQSRSTQPQNFVQWGTFLASHGFIVMFVDTGTDGCPGTRTTALGQAIGTLIDEDKRSGSPLFGQVDTTSMAAMGHSFGGSGALYLACGTHSASLKAVIGLTPVITNGYYATDNVPSLLIAGQNDPHTSDSQQQYDSISTTSKMLAEFAPVSTVQISMHHIADTPLGTNATDPVVARVALSFLELFLNGDTRYQQFLIQDPSMAVFAKNF
jgi:hypothetical protein